LSLFNKHKIQNCNRLSSICAVKKTDTYTCIAQLVLLLQDFQYTIEHYPERSKYHAFDALSHNTLLAMLLTEFPSSIIAKLHRNQIDNEERITVRNKVDKRQSEKYLIQDGLLCKRKNGEILIVVPKLEDSLIWYPWTWPFMSRENRKITKNGLLV